MLKPLLPTAIICIGQLVCTSAYAISEFTASYGVYPSFDLRTSDSDSGIWTCGSGSVCSVVGGTDQISVQYDQSGYIARAVAAPGALRARADAEWPDFIAEPRFAWAEASLTDTLTLTHPDIDPSLQNIGTRLRIRFRVDGDLAFTGAGTADFLALFTAQAGSSGFHASRFEAVYNADGLLTTGTGGFDAFAWPAGTTGSPFGIFETYAWMPYNQPIDILWALGAGASLLPEDYGSASAGTAHARLDNTAVFLGMDIMEFDEFGSLRPVDGARISSTSGYNWASPVPLPASVWLLLSGLVMLLRPGLKPRSRRR